MSLASGGPGIPRPRPANRLADGRLFGKRLPVLTVT